MTDEEIIAAVAAVLARAGWSNVVCVHGGAGWVVGGHDPTGEQHLKITDKCPDTPDTPDDPVEAARWLVEHAKRGGRRARAAPASPPPEPVQESPHVPHPETVEAAIDDVVAVEPVEPGGQGGDSRGAAGFNQGPPASEAEILDRVQAAFGQGALIDERRNAISLEIDAMALDRTEAARNVVRNFDFAGFNNRQMLGAVTQTERDAYDTYRFAVTRITTVTNHANALKRSLRDKNGDELDRFDPTVTEWP